MSNPPMKFNKDGIHTAAHTTKCDPRQVDRYLNNELSVAEESALILHCDHCEPCCQRLQHTAADPTWWHHVQSLLSSGELDKADHVHSHNDARIDTPADPVDPLSPQFLAPTDDPRMLGRFAGHEITGVIGSGGMGIVLKGLDPSLGRYAAIKVLAPHYASSGAARQRFAREARAAAAVVHDNVIAIHSVGQFNDVPYLIMPFIRGESLQKRLDRVGPLPIIELLRIAVQVLDGLAAAHAQGLIHRDIKPANILMSDGIERVFITDFGLARAADDASLTRSGVIAGTPAYMSPEQARGEPLDPRSDLFSVGSLMYSVATGRLPFRAETPYGVLQRINDDVVQPVHCINPELPAWLSKLIAKLQAKSPDDRYDTADEAATLVRQCLLHLETADKDLPMSLQIPDRTYPAVRRWAAVVATAITLSGVLAAAIVNWPRLNRFSGAQTASYSPPPSTHREPAAPVSFWDDPRPAELVDQTSQLLTEMTLP